MGNQSIRRHARIEPAAMLAVIVAVVWYAGLTLHSRAAGVIGNDPVTYVQMAIDLAERGTPTRAFPLLAVMREQGLSRAAALPVGYRLAAGREGVVPVFAFGAPVLLAVAWRLAGESGLYALTPVLGAASLVVVFALARRLLAGAAPAQRAVIAALTVVLLSTTPKQIALVIVPMSDAPAQLASALALLLTLVAEGWRPWPARLIWLASGLALGLAYLIRHSALLMVIPLLWLIWTQPATGLRLRRFEGPAWLAVGLGLMMAPDLAYRAAHLEHLTAVESPESAVWGWQYLLPNALRMASDLASWRGFGPLVALAAPGVAVMWRWAGRRATVTLLLWLAVFALFHLPLALTGVFENSLRYLIPAYPPLAIFIAAGCAGVIARAASPLLVPCLVLCLRLTRHERAPVSWHDGYSSWLRGLAWAGALVLLGGGLAFAARAVVKPPDPRFTYGWIGVTTRADLERLAQALPADAVIGANDQMLGALALYTGRDVFRPAAFVSPADEFARFLEAMRQTGRPVFVLGNLGCLADGPDDQRLPAWIQHYPWRDTGLTLRELPFECEQRLYRAGD